MKRLFIKLSQISFLITLFTTVLMAQQAIDWGTQAVSLRGKDGQRFTFACPGNGTISGSIWGTDVYTDDSSICTAAVHSGLISVQQGGIVTIEIRTGLGSYAGSTRNGVATKSYGGWSGSYVFFGKITPPGATTISWGTNLTNLRGQNGQRFTCFCPGGGTISSSLWGTDVYTDDSSVCTAAVHAGLINTQSGGNVTVEIRAGTSSYNSSTRNGVTSKGYGNWSGSYVFVSGGATTGATPINWGSQAVSWRGQNGQRYVLQCPAGGTISGSIWGTDLYTDDSSICTAAVHAGLITVSGGGSVTIEIRLGAGSYTGSTRNGVSTRNYGNWNGSYVFVR